MRRTVQTQDNPGNNRDLADAMVGAMQFQFPDHFQELVDRSNAIAEELANRDADGDQQRGVVSNIRFHRSALTQDQIREEMMDDSHIPYPNEGPLYHIALVRINTSSVVYITGQGVLGRYADEIGRNILTMIRGLSSGLGLSLYTVTYYCDREHLDWLMPFTSILSGERGRRMSVVEVMVTDNNERGFLVDDRLRQVNPIAQLNIEGQWTLTTFPDDNAPRPGEIIWGEDIQLYTNEQYRQEITEAKKKEYISRISSETIRMMSPAEKRQVLKNAAKFAKTNIDKQLYCSKCKHTGWVETRNDYRAKRGQAYKYPCPNCNIHGNSK